MPTDYQQLAFKAQPGCKKLEIFIILIRMVF